ncbi:MAG: molecular chaperone TorD family protein [bacterium]
MAEHENDRDESRRRTHEREAERHLLAWLILAFRRPTLASLREIFSVDPGFLLREAGYADGGVPDRLPPPEAAEMVLDELASEYVRLFVNAPATPVAHLAATAYLVNDGPEAQVDYLTALQLELAKAGLGLAPESTEPPDHLTLLLERLYLCDNDGADSRIRSAFARSFLAGWLPPFLARLAAADPLPLYRIAGAVLATMFQVTIPAAEEGHE